MRKLLSKHKHLNSKALLFLILFYINIGSKSVFRFLSDYNMVMEGVLLLSFFIFISLLKCRAIFIGVITYSIFFFTFLCFMSFAGPDLDYGLQKAFLGILVPVFLFNIFSKKDWKEEEIIRYLIVSVLCICVIGVLYKLEYGFFNRSVSFGLLGAIPFGWVNGMAFLAVVLKKEKSHKDLLLSLFFFLMILWTGSKGPLLGVVIIFVLFFNRIMGRRIRTKLISLGLVIGSFFLLKAYSSDIRSINMIASFLQDPEEYSQGAGSGSFGAREDFMKASINIFLDHPIFGVGFGGWQTYSLVETEQYPHNFILELLSETGIVGTFILIILLFKIFDRQTSIGCIGLFGLISLMFSGDISYFRYAFYPLLMAFYLFKSRRLSSGNQLLLEYKNNHGVTN